MGLVSFWYGDVHTAGAIYYSGGDVKEKKRLARIQAAINSREEVLKHPKYIECLSEYGDIIGINAKPTVL